MPNSARAKVGLLRIEAWVVWATAGGLTLTVIWLASDREPTQKEMTFSYRKHLAAEVRQRNAGDAISFLNNRLHDFELIKGHCEKLDVRRYRCDAILLVKDHPAEHPLPAKSIIYVHDAMGWTFEAPDSE